MLTFGSHEENDSHIFIGAQAYRRRAQPGYPSLETGGQLLGLRTHGQAHTVFLATGPGPKPSTSGLIFLQSPQSHQATEAFVWSSFGLQNIGFWHSHHQLPFHELSWRYPPQHALRHTAQAPKHH